MVRNKNGLMDTVSKREKIFKNHCKNWTDSATDLYKFHRSFFGVPTENTKFKFYLKRRGCAL